MKLYQRLAKQAYKLIGLSVYLQLKEYIDNNYSGNIYCNVEIVDTTKILTKLSAKYKTLLIEPMYRVDFARKEYPKAIVKGADLCYLKGIYYDTILIDEGVSDEFINDEFKILCNKYIKVNHA